MSHAGIYIHVPFCRQKCPYCNFYSVPVSETLMEQYTEAVCRNLRSYANDVSVDSVYFGGGTPSVLSCRQLCQILDTVGTCFSLAADTEVTLECNPATLTRAEMQALRRAGYNRISFGVQSLSPRELQLLGRIHSAETAVMAVEEAALAEFTNISCDVMLALPGQTAEVLTETLTKLVQLPIQHVSAYLLKIESGTPFAEMAADCPEEDQAADLYLLTTELLEQAGFLQYEVSNYARAGFESRHNCKYWTCVPYLGIGPSAHSCWNGVRFSVPASVSDFLQRQRQLTVTEDASACGMDEKIMLGMRLKKGVPAAWLPGKRAFLEKLCDAGYLEWRDDRVCFTPKGFLVSNTILAQLL